MRLYTEEQVIETVWRLAQSAGRTAILVELNSLRHIKLPSDEGIDKGTMDLYPLASIPRKLHLRGAKWVIEQIKQQEIETLNEREELRDKHSELLAERQKYLDQLRTRLQEDNGK